MIFENYFFYFHDSSFSIYEAQNIRLTNVNKTLLGFCGYWVKSANSPKTANIS